MRLILSSLFPTWHTIPEASIPLDLSSWTVLSMFSFFLLETMTLQPYSPRRSTTALPIPVEEAVTIATLFLIKDIDVNYYIFAKMQGIYPKSLPLFWVRPVKTKVFPLDCSYLFFSLFFRNKNRICRTIWRYFHAISCCRKGIQVSVHKNI